VSYQLQNPNRGKYYISWIVKDVHIKLRLLALYKMALAGIVESVYI
jgi:hypothetical protein